MKSKKNRQSSSRANLVWHILFFDFLVLQLNYGGYAVYEMIFHSICLSIATVALFRYRNFRSIPKIYFVIFGLVLMVALLQLLPLPMAWVPHVAPVKYRIIETVRGFYPFIEHGNQISFIPELHYLKLASLCLDFYLILLLLATPAPKGNLLRGWLYVVSIVLGTLAIFNSKGLLTGDHLLSSFHGTFGGFVNRNHFSVFAVAVMIFLAQQLHTSVLDIFKEFRNVTGRDNQKVLSHAIQMLFSLSCMALLFYSFTQIWSRSGLLAFLVASLTYISLNLLFMREVKRQTKLILALAFLILMVSLPLGKGAEKLWEFGFEDGARQVMWGIGFSYVKEAPILGVGFGASECILDPVIDRRKGNIAISRNFHNEYLQTWIELGIVGFLCLLAFFFQIGRTLLPELMHKSKHRLSSVSSLITVILVLMLVSMGSYPLRVPALRLFIITVICLEMAKFAVGEKRFFPRKKWVPIFVTLVVGPLIYFTWSGIRYSQLESVPYGEREARYGYHYRVSFLEARVLTADILFDRLGDRDLGETIAQGIEKVEAHLKVQPFNLRAMNLLFVLEVFEHRYRYGELDKDSYLVFKEKAKHIYDLANGKNEVGNSSPLFLFSIAPEHLSEADLKFKRKLEAANMWSLVRARMRINQEARAKNKPEIKTK